MYIYIIIRSKELVQEQADFFRKYSEEYSPEKHIKSPEQSQLGKVPKFKMAAKIPFWISEMDQITYIFFHLHRVIGGQRTPNKYLSVIVIIEEAIFFFL